MTFLQAPLLKILFLLVLFLASTPGQALNSTNAKWLVFDRQGDITLGSAKKWQRDWTHATVLRHNLLLVYDRNSGNAKTAVISHDGTLQQPHTYKWTTIWSDIMPANFLNGVDANVVLYSRDTGDFKAFKLETNKATLRFSQTIPNLITNTDQAKGWDIVVPFNYSGVSRVLFYQRSTGTAQFYKYSSQSKTLELQSTTIISSYWDQIAAGNFDDDDDQELVLHNQDGGEVRIWDPYAKTVKDLPNAGIAHTALLGVGEHYGGESRSDILLYQAHYRLSEDCGKAQMNPVLIVGKPRTGSDSSCHGGGRAILYVDNKSGDYGIKSIDTGWRSDWTHLIANNYSFGLYSNARSVKLHFVVAGLKTTWPLTSSPTRVSSAGLRAPTAPLPPPASSL
ncbi:hypothetical protein G8764_16855 [Pseudomaricurvus alcaniphilus]|uniref:hypothetical protein n=1 Tax=Pseudomaricurvus alcaniphilus TaxID=1166482 RepID=UPI00140CE587|nr:hypothetical protein [Pseudomaricurvus alcaniphilus]NHN38981.1 hypothetical protein [Pseudomaricurvus alcaniphilus]